MKYLDHCDIVVTHECMNHCPFCIDRFVHQSNQIVSDEAVENFLSKIRNFTTLKIEVLFLGGEPTCAGLDRLKELSKIVRYYGFSPIISTNNPNFDEIVKLLPYFDWVQYTIHNDKQIDLCRPYKDKINLKLAGDGTLTFNKLRHFIEVTKEFQRKSISVYFTPDYKELCTDNEIQKLFNTLSFKRNGSYLYAFYEGVRIKRCIPGETNIIDEPTVPKLYPNGNYNKTWCNEDMDDYLVPKYNALGLRIPSDWELQ